MEFFKFPKTPHLFTVTEHNIRDDKVLSEPEAKQFLNNFIVLEEKVDGANIGISLDQNGDLQIQNRGNYIFPGSHPQFNLIWEWSYSRIDFFKKYISNNFIVFGEWCHVKHSIHYTSLTDWFLGFDIYDKKNHFFLNTERRNQTLELLNIRPIPIINKGIFSKKELEEILNTTTSKFYSGPVEGIYLRYENSKRLIKRAKIVRDRFMQEISLHWSKGKIITNSLQNKNSDLFIG
ncbi:MAG: RNA ligase family protein [Marinifilaceae bacterium]|nr:RNA ligase family protein [Marinifilaceae bacterium]